MPKQVVIENPVINSPFREPQRHFRFSEDGITDEILEERRVSSYFMPIAKPKKKDKPDDGKASFPKEAPPKFEKMPGKEASDDETLKAIARYIV